MPVYRYTAEDTVRQMLSGTLIADTPVEGRQQLRERGWRILEFQTALRVSPTLRWKLPQWGNRGRRHQVAESARFLALLLRAGVPLTESLDVLTRQQRGKLTDLLKTIRERVAQGSTLADAIGQHPAWFDDLFISAVRVGELSGQLEDALIELAGHLESQEQLRGQISHALIYPALVSTVGIGVVLFLMTYVIPQLLTVLQASGKSLPTSTRLLQSVSDGVIQYWPLMLIGLVALITLLSVVLRTTAGKRVWHRTILRLPLLGPLLQRHLVAQFAQRLALLLKTGVTFLEAVRCVLAISKHQLLKDELQLLAGAVESGRDIAPALAKSTVFPPVVVHLFGVGQETGELPDMLTQLKARYESEVKLAVSKFTAALEPTLIVFLAGGVGFVVYACLMPILEATRGIQ